MREAGISAGPSGSVGEDAFDGAVFFPEEAGCLPTHAQGEAGEAGGFGGEEVEEVPLRHERDEFCVTGNMGEVGHGDAAISDEAGETGDLSMGNAEEFFEEAKFVEEFECGGMDGVAAEVAEKVCMFLEDGDGDALAGEEKAEHDACRASADDAAGGGELICVWAHGGMRVTRAGKCVKRAS